MAKSKFLCLWSIIPGGAQIDFGDSDFYGNGIMACFNLIISTK